MLVREYGTAGGGGGGGAACGVGATAPAAAAVPSLTATRRRDGDAGAEEDERRALLLPGGPGTAGGQESEGRRRGGRHPAVAAVLAAAAFLLFTVAVAAAFAFLSASSSSSPLPSLGSNEGWIASVWGHLNNGHHLHGHHHHRRRRRYDKARELLSDLDGKMAGSVLFRDDDHDGEDFDTSWKVWNERANSENGGGPPFAVVQVANAEDASMAVPVLIEIENELGIPFAVKSGGHNYAGWSSAGPDGIVLSLHNINEFHLEIPDSGDDSSSSSSYAVATMGPGTTDLDILKRGLLENGYSGVCGSSSTVNMGGWMLGGGLGYWSRTHGLGIDNLVEADVVLPTGELVTANSDDSNDHSDLFWALRGAGQANFGVVVGYRYKLYPAQDEILIGSGSIPYGVGAEVLSKIGDLEPTLPRETVSLITVSNDGEGNLAISMWGIGNGENDLVRAQAGMQELVRNALPDGSEDLADGFSYDRTSWYQSSIDETEELEGFYVRNWNGFLLHGDGGSSLENWKKVMKFYERFKGSPYVLVDAETFGGAIGDAAPDATAFPWRDAAFSVGVLVLVPAADDGADATFEKVSEHVERHWHRDGMSKLLKGTFVNYAMGTGGSGRGKQDEEEYAKIAWGDNLERLKKVKAKYDPENAFHSALTIPLDKK